MSKPSTTKKAPKTTKTKPSGVEWLGDIPEHWEVLPFLSLFEPSTERNGKNAVGEMLSISGVRGVEVKKYESESQKRSAKQLEGYRVLRGDQLAVNTMWLNHCGLAVSSHIGHMSPAYRAYSISNKLFPRYAHYLLRSKPYINEYTGLMQGIRPNSLQIKYEDFKRIPVLVPPKAEQDKIVAFLDRKTSQIDALIEKKQRLLKLLDEQLAIKINNAVTKGIVNAQYGTLNPHLSTKTTPIYTTHTSPLKKSGIEWIGEIPEDWEIAQLRHLIDKIDQGVSPQTIEGICVENEWGVLKSGCCNGGEFSQEQHKKLPLNFKIDENNILHIGDLLVSRACGSRALVGATALVKQLNYNLILSDKNFRLKPKPFVNNGFLNYSMNSFHFRRQIDPRISGADGLPNNIASSKLKEISIPVANHEQQTMIVNSIAAMIDLKSKEQYKLQQQISSLKELRNTFVSKAVKGGVL